MYKILFVFGVVIAMAISHELSPEKKKQVQDLTNAASKDCRTESGVSHDDIVLMSKYKLPNNKEAHCYLKCMLTTFSMMKDGKFDKQGFMMMAQPYLEGEEKALKDIAELADNCEKITTGDDPCEVAMTATVCIYHESKRLGFDMPVADP